MSQLTAFLWYRFETLLFTLHVLIQLLFEYCKKSLVTCKAPTVSPGRDGLRMGAERPGNL
jgi:hypothetical protein